MSTFQGYKPLSAESRQIRLLTLLPSLLSSSTIKCELSIASLNDNPQYEALSYVWGTPADPKYIELDKQRFSVTQNLHAALRALRCRRTKRVMWVDAVCINQLDIPERNAQVAQMRFIYESARQVAVWLGDESAGSVKALEFVKTFAAQVRAHQSSPEVLKSWLVDTCVDCSGAQEKMWEELALLLSRPYWTRAWIYQEMVLASRATVYCGRDLVPWDDMEKVAFAIDAFENLLRTIEPPTNDHRVVGVYHWFYNAALARSQRRAMGLMGAPTLLEALCTQRPANATDPRDKVYSLLGVVKDNIVGLGQLPAGPDVVIDYSRATAKVYKDVVRHIIKKTGSLDVLCACQNPERANGIPSWAPDWSTKRTNGPIQNPDQWGHIHFASSPISSVMYIESPDDDTLHVGGVYMDTVTGAGHVHTYGCDWEELKENWKALAVTCAWTFESAAEAGPCYITTESIAEAFFATVTMGRIDTEETGHEREDLIRIELARIEAIEQRRFFVTDKGFMALGPAQTQPGDRVVVVCGSHVPFVLRQDDDGDGYAVVGEAYVHGLMNGEALDEKMSDGWEENLGRRPEVEAFHLR